MLELPHRVETPRLVLRPIDAAGDVDAIHAYASRDDFCRYIPWTPKTRDEVAAWLPGRNATTIPEPDQAASLAITLRDDGALIGDLMFIWVSDTNQTGEIGYVLNPTHQGHGYATEAARALLEVGFNTFKLHRMTAWADTRNHPSLAVLRKLGMRHEATQIDNIWTGHGWTSQADYALLDHEWRKQPTPHRKLS